MIGRLSRCILFSTIMLCMTASLSALEEVRRPSKENEDWRVLKQAEDAYTAGEYGSSINLADKAIESRKQECAWKLYVLESSFQNTAIRKAGDSISDILVVLQKRESKTAIGIIQRELDQHGKETFGNSIQKLKDYIAAESVYPEAYYLIGKIYRLEGENVLALQYMKKAYSYAHALDVPEVKYDIVYDIANLSYDSGNMDDYETYLLEVMKDNQYYRDSNVFMPALLRTIKTDKEDGVDKFFKLYRSNDYLSIPACKKLTLYYMQNGKDDKALNFAALGALTSFTRIYECIADRNIGYTYTSFKEVIAKAGKYSDIVTWGDTEGAWELFYLFAKESAAQGSLIFARKLYTDLSIAEPIEYWRIQAEKALITRAEPEQ